MARGIAVPVGPNVTGGVSIVEGETNAHKIISLALSDLDNDNAFQQFEDYTMGTVFKANTSNVRAYVTARLIQTFTEFEKKKLFRLDRASIQWSKGAPGETILDFRYINLESDHVESYSRAYKANV